MKPAKKRKEITLWTLLWTVFKWRWWQLGVCLALSITNSTIGLYLPQFAGALMDKIPHVQRWEDVEPLFWKIIIWTFIAGCISLAQQYLENVVDLFLSLHSQNYVLHLLMGKDMDFFLHPLCEPRMLPSRVSQDAKELAFLVHTFSFQVINTFYGLALTIIILFTGVNMPVKTLLIGLAAHPFSAIITILIGHYSESMTVCFIFFLFLILFLLVFFLFVLVLFLFTCSLFHFFTNGILHVRIKSIHPINKSNQKKD